MTTGVIDRVVDQVMGRKTKIKGTIGPASYMKEVLRELIRLGMDVLRLNFAHIREENFEFYADLIQFARDTADEFGLNLAIYGDLAGIKLRLGEFVGQDSNIVHLSPGEVVYLRDSESSDDGRFIPFPYADILADLVVGDRVYFADGTIRVDVIGRSGNDVEVEVQHGGDLSSYKGINLPGVTVNHPVLTEQDKVNARFCVEQGVDWIGISFVQSAQDLLMAKAFLDSIGCVAAIMAKIEKRRALEDIDAIIRVIKEMPNLGGIMVARGDLGIEIPMEQVPRWQKELLEKAMDEAILGETATQMLVSMVHAPRPTRPECSDIQNAILDGTSSILLSDEIAVGEYVIPTLQVAVANCIEGEKLYKYYPELTAVDDTEKTARSACQQARDYDDAIMLVVSQSGKTAITITKYRPKAPVIVVTHDIQTMRKLAMAWSIQPGGIIPVVEDIRELKRLALNEAIRKGAIDPNRHKHIIMVYGSTPGVPGSADIVQHVNLQNFLETERVRDTIAA